MFSLETGGTNLASKVPPTTVVRFDVHIQQTALRKSLLAHAAFKDSVQVFRVHFADRGRGALGARGAHAVVQTSGVVVGSAGGARFDFFFELFLAFGTRHFRAAVGRGRVAFFWAAFGRRGGRFMDVCVVVWSECGGPVSPAQTVEQLWSLETRGKAWEKLAKSLGKATQRAILVRQNNFSCTSIQ